MLLPIRTLADIDDKRQPSVMSFRRQVDKPVSIHRHMHRRSQLLLVAAGLITVHADSGRWVVPAGTAFWISPGVEHALFLHGKMEGWFVYLDEMPSAWVAPDMGAARVSALLREAVARHALYCQAEASPPREAVFHLGQVIQDEVAALRFETAYLPMPLDRRMMRIARVMIQDPANNSTLEEMAEKAGLSRRTATRRFASETGLSFSVWRHRLRMMRALERLAAGHGVTETALGLGYDSPSAFSAVFKRCFGASPSHFRPKG